MSGVLSSITSDLLELFETASWRGVTFHMTRSADTAGRRMVRFWFPGADRDDTEDLGAFDQGIRIEGLILGTDYIVRATRMRAALLASGPAQLVHPWWGPLQCELIEAGALEFSDTQLGVVRFSAAFRRVPTAAGNSLLDTVSGLLTAADAVVDGATLMFEQLLSPLSLGAALVAGVTGMTGQAVGIWNGLVGGVPEAISSAAAPAIATLAAGIPVPATNPDTTYADALAAAYAGPPAAIADAINDTTATAVAPSGEVPATVTDVDPKQVTTILLAGAAALIAIASSPAAASPGSPLPTLALAAAALSASQAAFASTSIVYTSQGDALSWKATIDAGLAALTDAASTVLNGAISSAGIQALSSLLAAIRQLRAAVAADISSRLGRLPVVATIAVPAQMSVWLIAQTYAGDSPAGMIAAVQDLVARNNIWNPALAGPGPLEALENPS